MAAMLPWPTVGKLRSDRLLALSLPQIALLDWEIPLLPIHFLVSSI